MPRWLEELDEGQRRVLGGLGALIAALALVAGGVVLTDDGEGDDEATVQTEGEGTSTTRSSTTSSSPTSTSVLGSTTSSSAPAAGSGGTTTTTRRRIGGGGATTTTRATNPGTQPTTPPTQPPSGGPCASGSGDARELADDFCAHRAARGLPAMSRNAALDAMAQEWAQKMANDQQLSHRPDAQARQMVAARCSCPGWGENVAWDSDLQHAWTDWLASPEHRANIENGSDGEHGLGVVTVNGVHWIVHVFGYYSG